MSVKLLFEQPQPIFIDYTPSHILNGSTLMSYPQAIRFILERPLYAVHDQSDLCLVLQKKFYS